MKTKLHFIKGTILVTSVLSGIAAQAQFSYNTGLGELGDVLVCFRRTNSGSYDLVVDAGSVSTFTSLTRGSSITIDPTYYSGSLLAYVGTNGIAWSALACQRSLANNVWVTRPRTNPGVQTTPWPVENTYVQAGAASQIDSIGEDAGNIAAEVTTPFGTSPTSSTLTTVVEPEGGINGAGSYFNSYSFQVGPLTGNLAGNFWGDAISLSVEQSTPQNFTSSGQSVIADFYQLLASNSAGLGTYLGYFKFDPTGVMTYTAGPYIVAPTITSITRTGNTTTITFPSVQGEIYNLRSTTTANAATPRSTWPVVGSPLTGDGGTDILTDTTADGSRVYVVTGQ